MLVAAHLMLASVYNVAVPIFEASDEDNHFFFARHLALTGRIPDVRYEIGPWGQPATQGPLYHVWAALSILFVATDDAPDLIGQMNPQVNLGDGSRPGNKNLFLHDPRHARWPWPPSVLAVHLARAVSALWGGVAVWATYHLVRRLASLEATAAAMFVALLPQFAFASGTVSNETASAATAALALWALAATPPAWPARAVILLGALLGLAGLAKVPGLILAGYLLLVVAA